MMQQTSTKSVLEQVGHRVDALESRITALCSQNKSNIVHSVSDLVSSSVAKAKSSYGCDLRAVQLALCDIEQGVTRLLGAMEKNAEVMNQVVQDHIDHLKDPSSDHVSTKSQTGGDYNGYSSVADESEGTRSFTAAESQTDIPTAVADIMSPVHELVNSCAHASSSSLTITAPSAFDNMPALKIETSSTSGKATAAGEYDASLSQYTPMSPRHAPSLPAGSTQIPNKQGAGRDSEFCEGDTVPTGLNPLARVEGAVDHEGGGDGEGLTVTGLSGTESSLVDWLANSMHDSLSI